MRERDGASEGDSEGHSDRVGKREGGNINRYSYIVIYIFKIRVRVPEERAGKALGR